MFNNDNTNILLLTDSYKISHWKQYPPKTEKIYSYYESRGGEFNHTVFFGLQYILKRFLSEPFNLANIYEAAELYEQHFGSSELFNMDGWKNLFLKHGGWMPVHIKAVPEGTRVEAHNVLMTIENTDPEFPWVTNFLETLLSQVWYPTTVATLSNETRRTILGWLIKNGDPALIDFKLHDFGFRGVSSVESASIGGGAHLVNFMGTDTVPALTFVRNYYGAKFAAGFSVPASEHSTITAWGAHNEVDAYRNMIDKYGEYPFYACVSDSYDLYNAAENLWGGVLIDEVLSAPGTLVVRPDSGDPTIVCNHLLDILGDKFGYERNTKGYKVLNPKVRIIQGDGMNLASIDRTLRSMNSREWSADNITFGMGGGLLQQVNRDTMKFAFKCSSAVINGVTTDVFKQPITDAGKNSKRGRLALVDAPSTSSDRFTTVLEAKTTDDANHLQTVYINGKLSEPQSLESIKSRAC